MWPAGGRVPFEEREIHQIRAPENVADITGDGDHANRRVDERVEHHPHHDDARHAPPDGLDEQRDRENRTREITDAGKEREDGIESEPDAGARNPEAQSSKSAHARSDRSHDPESRARQWVGAWGAANRSGRYRLHRNSTDPAVNPAPTEASSTRSFFFSRPSRARRRAPAGSCPPSCCRTCRG